MANNAIMSVEDQFNDIREQKSPLESLAAKAEAAKKLLEALHAIGGAAGVPSDFTKDDPHGLTFKIPSSAQRISVVFSKTNGQFFVYDPNTSTPARENLVPLRYSRHAGAFTGPERVIGPAGGLIWESAAALLGEAVRSRAK